MECPSCGADIAEGSRFCPFCGRELRSGGGAGSGGGTEPRETVVAEERDAAPERRPELAVCPRCQAPNSARRVLCGRCGADLETGDLGVPASAATEDAPATLPQAPEPSRRIWVAVIVVGALVGSAIGVGVWLWTGRGGGVADGGPTFDPAAHPAEPTVLDVAQATASSRLPPERSIAYGPELAVDGDRTTAWNEGVEGDGEGETLRLELAGESWVSELLIHNGYQQDERSFLDNARASRLLVRVGDLAFELHLLDRSGAQRVALPQPVLAGTVTFQVLEVVPGEQYQDLAISEVTVGGWPAEG